MIMVVVSFIIFVRASCILNSVSTSTELVESSKIKILGFTIKARAIDKRCFCPPDNLVPLSPTNES